MAAYVKRAVALFGARVSLIHVADPGGYNGLQLYVRPITEILEEHLSLCRERLDSFLAGEFPVVECPRTLTLGDAATEIARVAKHDAPISSSCPRTRENFGKCCSAQLQLRRLTMRTVQC
jgi:hypothetical protein